MNSALLMMQELWVRGQCLLLWSCIMAAHKRGETARAWDFFILQPYTSPASVQLVFLSVWGRAVCIWRASIRTACSDCLWAARGRGSGRGAQPLWISGCLSSVWDLNPTGFGFGIAEISQHSEDEVSFSCDWKICKLQTLCMQYFVPEKLNLGLPGNTSFFTVIQILGAFATL